MKRQTSLLLSFVLALAAVSIAPVPVMAGVCDQDPQLCQQRNQVRERLKPIFASAVDGVLSFQEYQLLKNAYAEAITVAQQLREQGFGRGFSLRYESRAYKLLLRTKVSTSETVSIELPVLIDHEPTH